MAENQATTLETISRLVQVISVVAGVTISVFSFNQARTNEANARRAELEKRLGRLLRKQGGLARMGGVG